MVASMSLVREDLEMISKTMVDLHAQKKEGGEDEEERDGEEEQISGVRKKKKNERELRMLV